MIPKILYSVGVVCVTTSTYITAAIPQAMFVFGVCLIASAAFNWSKIDPD